MLYIPSCYNLMSNLAAWKKLKFESVFLLDLLLHDWFVINLQMLTE